MLPHPDPEITNNEKLKFIKFLMPVGNSKLPTIILINDIIECDCTQEYVDSGKWLVRIVYTNKIGSKVLSFGKDKKSAEALFNKIISYLDVDEFTL